ncbi:hypothetical protein MXB_3750 [Myxobolus squamalis]|nr:hypothetical protein MXB_3750 [Myxobolus squamalis]
MLGLIWFLTVQLDGIDKNSIKNTKFCVNHNCNGLLSDNCPKYMNISDKFDVFGKTYDGEYYSILIYEEEYYIPKSCVLNQTQILPMEINVPIKSFNLLNIFNDGTLPIERSLK